METRRKGHTGDRVLTYTPKIYVASSFRHMHAVQLLGRELVTLGYEILDWTEKAALPPGLTPAQRRAWMDTDQEGGQVFSFCKDACINAHILVYFGASGQDAGVEVGFAYGAGVPTLGVRGPLEAPGLMLHGAMNVWTDTVEEALALLHNVAEHARDGCTQLGHEPDKRVRTLCTKLAHV